MKKAIAVLLIVLLPFLLLSGCANHPAPAADQPSAAEERPSPTEAGSHAALKKRFIETPWKACSPAGKYLGWPLAVVSLPITIPLTIVLHDQYVIAAPMIGAAYLCGTICAAPGWLLFGWWGNDESERVPSAPEQPPPSARSRNDSSPQVNEIE